MDIFIGLQTHNLFSTMRIFLFKVVIGSDSFNLSTRLRHISSLPVEERNRERNTDHIRLEHLDEQRDLLFADFLKIRMHHGPAKAGLDTPVEGFDLGDDEGFGEETAFLFDPNTGYAVLQYNHHGPWPSAIAEYLGMFIHDDPVIIEFAPKLDPTVHAKIKRAKIVKKFALTVAPKCLGEEDYQQQGSLGSAIEQLSTHADAERLEIVVSASRAKGSSLNLSLQSLSQWVRKLGGSSDHSPILTARATTKADDNSSSEVLDLLEHKITKDADLIPGHDKRYPRNERWNALEVAFNSWRNLMT